MGKAGKMKGKDIVPMTMQSKGKKIEFIIDCRTELGVTEYEKGQNNGNRADGRIMQQSNPKVGWIMTSTGREDGRL